MRTVPPSRTPRSSRSPAIDRWATARLGLCAAFVVGSALATSACAGGCKRSAPYVPFLEDAATPLRTGQDPASGDAAVDGGTLRAYAGVHAQLAPAAATKWMLDGLALEAPVGQLFVSGVAYDVDGDGKRDAVAYVQPPGGGGGELRFYRGESATKVAGASASIAIAAADLALPAPCFGKPVLALVGAHTVAIDLHPACNEAAGGASSQRRFALIAFAPTPAVRWSARIGEPPPGWTLTIDAEALDRDGDGVDDPTLTFGLEGGGPPFEPGERVAAKLKFTDRPAGLARDRVEPETSFQSIAQLALQKASKKATAIGVRAHVVRLRMLHAAICAEGGAPLIDVGGDHGIACGPSRALEDATVAEVKASLALGDLVGAVAAREWLSIGVLAHTKRSRADADRAILAAAPTIWAVTRDVKAIASTPTRNAPAWGALAFEKGGDLLVRTVSGVARVDATTLDDDDANDVPSWPSEVVYPGKDAQLGGVFDTCDGANLGAKVSGHDVPTGSTFLALPLLAHFGTNRCAGGRGAPAQVVPIAWGAGGLSVLVDLDAVWIPTELTTVGGVRSTGTLPAPGTSIEGNYVLGSPRSPSGDLLVVATRFGVIRRDETAETPVYALIRSRELEGLYTSLRECAIANDGVHLACVREGKVVMIDASGAADPTASASGATSGSTIASSSAPAPSGTLPPLPAPSTTASPPTP